MNAPNPSTSRRIALVGPAGPWRGGIAQYVDALDRTLRERGHHTRVLTFHRQYPKLLFPGKSQWDADRVPGPDTRLVLDTLNPFTWREGGRWLADWEPDLVLFNYWLPFFVPTYAGVIRQLDRSVTRVVFDCHNVRPHEHRLLDGPLTSWMLRLPDRFLVHSRSVRDTLREACPDGPVEVSPLPISADFPDGPGRAAARARLGLGSVDRVLLFFGFVRRYKGLDLALASMSHLPDDVHLVLAGEFYESRDHYADALTRVGPRVHVHDDFIPTSEVGVYFDAADVVVLPYHRATQSGILPLAWRFGVPVVATAVGGLVEHIRDGENGYLVSGTDPADFAAAVRRALDPETSRRLGEGVRETRRELGWDRLAETVERLAADPIRSK